VGEGRSEADAEDTRRNSRKINAEGSGWVTTKQAAKALGVTPRTVQSYIKRGILDGKTQGEGVKLAWLVSIDSLNSLRAQRLAEADYAETFRGDSPESGAEGFAEVVRNLYERLADEAARASAAEVRLELTEKAESTIREERDRFREERDRLRAELESERSKGFWSRLFGG
jgi:DNA-binding transcriptional MerR regulator